MLWPAFVLLLLGALAWSAFTLAVGVEFRSVDQRIHNGDPGKLKTPILAQSFTSPHPNLSRVEMQLAQPITLPLPPDIEIMLLRGEGPDAPLIYGTLLAPSNVITEAGVPFVSLGFPPIADSSGVTFTFVLRTPGYSVNSAMRPAWSPADALSSGAMYTEDGVQGGDLAISAYYRYGLAQMAGDVWGALTGRLGLIVWWLALLVLPGLALLAWLPSGLSLDAGQRLLAAPALSALALPVLFLLSDLVGVPIGRNKLLLLLGVCLLAVGARALWDYRRRAATSRARGAWPSSLAFWLAFASVLTLSAVTRLITLRDMPAGPGMDAYHHTLLTALFLLDAGIPEGYEPFAPLSSFTYHFGFHTLAAALGWLSGHTASADLAWLVPQVGQVAGSVLPVPALTLFGWRALSSRWAGLAAGALASLVSVVPAYYAEWSRYTQGLGLAVLPVAWVLTIEAVRTAEPEAPTREVAWRALKLAGALLPAVVAAAGLFLTHYRISVIFAAFLLLYIISKGFNPEQAGRLMMRAYATRLLPAASRLALVAVAALLLLLPWLANLNANFVKSFIDRGTPDIDRYFATAERLGSDVLAHPSLPVMALLGALGLTLIGRGGGRAGQWVGALSGAGWVAAALYLWLEPGPQALERDLGPGIGGLPAVTLFLAAQAAALLYLAFATATAPTSDRHAPDEQAARAGGTRVRAETLVLLPAIAWVTLGLWSSPLLLPVRLPLTGYLDSVTLASGAWLPASLLGGYALARVVGAWWPRAAFGTGQSRRLLLPLPLPGYATAAALGVLLLAGLASGLSLAPVHDRRPYVEEADLQALRWMGDSLPPGSYVLASAFTFPWSPGQVLGLDAGLWVPLMTGARSSVPPITAYNERPQEGSFFAQVKALSAIRPGAPSTDWAKLREAGITHIFIGSRSAGDGFSAPDLLASGQAEQVYHSDGVWLFRVR